MTRPGPLDKYFAMKVIRKLTKSAAANEIGPDAALLVCIIAAQWDAKRYNGPVTFFNDQLQPLCGFRKWERLDRARKAAIRSGWLLYEAPPNGSRGTPGRYSVTIPGHLMELNDAPVDETERIPETDMVGGQRIPNPDRVHRGHIPPRDTVHDRAYSDNGDGRGNGQGETHRAAHGALKSKAFGGV